MRPALRLFAAVSRATPSSSALYSEPGLPTGLTGLLTHYSPRSSLLHLYSTTLDKLAAFPESSTYRQSTEALTRHRMSIVESVKPAGLAEWQQRVAPLVDANPEAFKRVQLSSGEEGFNIVYDAPPPEDAHLTVDDKVKKEYKAKPQLEGPRAQEEVSDRGEKMSRDAHGEAMRQLRVEREPALTMEQISEMEQKIGAGLIEEVIAVAEGEKKLAETMAQYKVWEDLEEKPVEGQWGYNERTSM